MGDALGEMDRLGVRLVRGVGPRAVIVVEGESDRLAVEALARVRTLDLDDLGIEVVATGGVTNFGRALRIVAPHRCVLRVTGLHDRNEEPYVRSVLARTGMEDARFFVCDPDLEAELIAAVGPEQVLAVIDAQGELDAFRTLQHQPAWSGRPPAEQLRRWFGAGARRKLRYATLLVATLEPGAAPAPLASALDHALA